jgi:DNA-binding NarL/FixJ family response regulator
VERQREPGPVSEPGSPAEPEPELTDWLEGHHEVTDAERFVLERVARGDLDEAIATKLDQSLAAVRSTLRRFRERTGLAGRMLVAWAVHHDACCISPPE